MAEPPSRVGASQEMESLLAKTLDIFIFSGAPGLSKTITLIFWIHSATIRGPSGTTPKSSELTPDLIHENCVKFSTEFCC